MIVNVLNISDMSYRDAASYLRWYEVQGVGVTVYTSDNPPAGPWAVGSGEVHWQEIASPISAQYGVVFGGWYSDKQGKYLWEKVRLFADLEDALRYAELRGEEAIFNIETGEEVWL